MRKCNNHQCEQLGITIICPDCGWLTSFVVNKKKKKSKIGFGINDPEKRLDINGT